MLARGLFPRETPLQEQNCGLSVRDGTFPSSWLDFPRRCSCSVPLPILSHSFFLSVSVSLSAFFFSLRPNILRDIDFQVFEWGGIIKRRTSNGGIQRNLIFRTKSIDPPIGRALTALSTEKAREREREDDAPKNSSYSGIRGPPETKRLGWTVGNGNGVAARGPSGTTNRFPLISIPAARTKATRLLYLRIDHARIYTFIRSAFVLASFLHHFISLLALQRYCSDGLETSTRNRPIPPIAYRFSSILQTSFPLSTAQTSAAIKIYSLLM